MSETKMQRIVLAARPQGTPTHENFRLEEQPIPALEDGHILVKKIYLSLDPYMRGRMDASKSYVAAVEVGDTMEGGCVAQVIASKNPKFQEGDYVNGMFGWASHAVHSGKAVRKLDPSIAPISTAVGVLGMPGLTAYVGLLTHGQPKAGETLVVSAATGAVGSLVGQLGKIHGLNVVGVAGGPEKCAYAVKELGYEVCLDHRDPALAQNMAAACPNGVDIYYENVGGATLEAVMPLMNVWGRIPICGMISLYNKGGLHSSQPSGPDQLPKMWRRILVNRLSLRGFIIFDHYDQFPEFMSTVGGYIREGKVTYHETITQGLEKAPEAFLGLLSGQNLGKQLVQVSEDSSRG